MEQVRLAIYDMDKTVTRKATFTAFLLHAARQLAPWRLLLLPVVGLVSLLYLLRLIDRGRLKAINYRLLVGLRSPDQLRPVVVSFVAGQLAANILPGARARIDEDKQASRRLILATASYRLYAEGIGRALGFDDVIGTRQRIDEQGRLLGTIEGENCYGGSKLTMILAWLEEQGLAREGLHIRFYSDHVSDAVVHRWADEPFATNPSRGLRDVAAQEGWPVLEWRAPTAS
jgi:HAD superfamily hydrolase (TIGR01490 family)